MSDVTPIEAHSDLDEIGLDCAQDVKIEAQQYRESRPVFYLKEVVDDVWSRAADLT